jgi:hypothetical protein
MCVAFAYQSLLIQYDHDVSSTQFVVVDSVMVYVISFRAKFCLDLTQLISVAQALKACAPLLKLSVGPDVLHVPISGNLSTTHLFPAAIACAVQP